MGLFDFLRRPERPDMDAELERFRNAPGAVLLDVRTPEEYAAGHIPAVCPCEPLCGRLDGWVE